MARSRLELLAGELPLGEPYDHAVGLGDVVRRNGWGRAAATWEAAPERMERFLRGVALTRSRTRRPEVPRPLLACLIRGYLATGDARIANEALYVAGSLDDRRTRGHLLLDLDDRRTPDGALPMPSRWRADFDPPTPRHAPRPLRIGLLGPAFLFVDLQQALERRGHRVFLFEVPNHPEPWRRRLMQRRLLTRGLYRLRGGRQTVHALPPDPASEATGRRLRRFDLDLGFHNLGFILREPVYAAFRLGLLNHHWGPLPAVRGLDSICWTLAYGRCPQATLHLVDGGIDTGPLVTRASFPATRSVGAARRAIRRRRDACVLRAVQLLASGAPPVPNEGGAQHYAMHPRIRSRLGIRS